MPSIYVSDYLKDRLTSSAIASGYDVKRGPDSQLAKFIDNLLDTNPLELAGNDLSDTWERFISKMGPILEKMKIIVEEQGGRFDSVVGVDGPLYIDFKKNTKPIFNNDMLNKGVVNSGAGPAEFMAIGRTVVSLVNQLFSLKYRVSSKIEGDALYWALIDIIQSVDGQAHMEDVIRDMGYEAGLPDIELEYIATSINDMAMSDGGYTEDKPIEEQEALANLALNIFPKLTDAYNVLASVASDRGEHMKALELYKKGMKFAEEKLGLNNPQNGSYSFWHSIETRPLMRSKLGTMLSLAELGRLDEAIECGFEMLKMNPSDNQGIRFSLVNYLLVKRDPRTDSYLKDMLYYKNSDTGEQEELGKDTCYLYSRACWLFQEKGDVRVSQDALSRAFVENPFVPYHFITCKSSKEIPDIIGYSRGTVEEAINYAKLALDFWKRIPGAIGWVGKRASKSSLIDKAMGNDNINPDGTLENISMDNIRTQLQKDSNGWIRFQNYDANKRWSTELWNHNGSKEVFDKLSEIGIHSQGDFAVCLAFYKLRFWRHQPARFDVSFFDPDNAPRLHLSSDWWKLLLNDLERAGFRWDMCVENHSDYLFWLRAKEEEERKEEPASDSFTEGYEWTSEGLDEFRNDLGSIIIPELWEQNRQALFDTTHWDDLLEDKSWKLHAVISMEEVGVLTVGNLAACIVGMRFYCKRKKDKLIFGFNDESAPKFDRFGMKTWLLVLDILEKRGFQWQKFTADKGNDYRSWLEEHKTNSTTVSVAE